MQDATADHTGLPHRPPVTPSATLRSSGGIGSFDGRSRSFIGGEIARCTVDAGDLDSGTASAALLPFFTGMAVGPAEAANGCPADKAPTHPLLDTFHTPAAAAAGHQPLQHTPQTAADASRPAAGDRDALQPGCGRRASGFVRIKRRHANVASALEAASGAARQGATGEGAVLPEGAGQPAARRKHGGASPRFANPALSSPTVLMRNQTLSELTTMGPDYKTRLPCTGTDAPPAAALHPARLAAGASTAARCGTLAVGHRQMRSAELLMCTRCTCMTQKTAAQVRAHVCHCPLVEDSLCLYAATGQLIAMLHMPGRSRHPCLWCRQRQPAAEGETQPAAVGPPDQQSFSAARGRRRRTGFSQLGRVATRRRCLAAAAKSALAAAAAAASATGVHPFKALSQLHAIATHEPQCCYIHTVQHGAPLCTSYCQKMQGDIGLVLLTQPYPAAEGLSYKKGARTRLSVDASSSARALQVAAAAWRAGHRAPQNGMANLEACRTDFQIPAGRSMVVFLQRAWVLCVSPRCAYPMVQVAGRLRAVSADRKGRPPRSPSVDDDLDEVTAILNQLRHR
jgi:hypothetical protein